jgi:L-phenylalanine/L-methionine N-acetyltransferase
MAAITVRAREARDLEALTAIANLPGVIHGTLQLPFRSLDERREQWGQPRPGLHSLVAEHDGRVVGQLNLHQEPSPRRRHCGSIGMSVHDDFVGRGIGSALMVAALELADNWLGLRRIELTVYTDNVPAIRLYEKFGFVTEGTRRDFALRAGVYVDALAMARLRG